MFFTNYNKFKILLRIIIKLKLYEQDHQIFTKLFIANTLMDLNFDKPRNRSGTQIQYLKNVELNSIFSVGDMVRFYSPAENTVTKKLSYLEIN